MTYRGKFVVKISRPGKSVSSTNPNDFVFHSDRSVAKIDLRADPPHIRDYTHTFSSNPGAGRLNLLKIEHKYPYTPALLAMVSFNGTNFRRMPVSYGVDFDTGSNEELQAYTDGKYLYIDLIRYGTTWQNINGLTYYFKYTVLDIVGME